mmetsp:Transcript_122761/g.393196  ORF Transcript_122761/g.393196 Transcript_122761/m.393196 type:complete len:347 (+) Transcript_122761:396-1436(+)
MRQRGGARHCRTFALRGLAIPPQALHCRDLWSREAWALAGRSKSIDRDARQRSGAEHDLVQRCRRCVQEGQGLAAGCGLVGQYARTCCCCGRRQLQHRRHGVREGVAVGRCACVLQPNAEGWPAPGPAKHQRGHRRLHPRAELAGSADVARGEPRGVRAAGPRLPQRRGERLRQGTAVVSGRCAACGPAGERTRPRRDQLQQHHLCLPGHASLAGCARRLSRYADVDSPADYCHVQYPDPRMLACGRLLGRRSVASGRPPRAVADSDHQDVWRSARRADAAGALGRGAVLAGGLGGRRPVARLHGLGYTRGAALRVWRAGACQEGVPLGPGREAPYALGEARARRH